MVDPTENWDVRFNNVFPKILKDIAAAKPETLLDYGCGHGEFMNMAAAFVSKKIYGYDISRAVNEAARKATAELPKAEIIDDLKTLQPGSIDVVTMNAVWMQFPTEEVCATVFKKIFNLLKPGGKLIASVTHPCFRDHKFTTHETNFDPVNYFKGGSPFTVFVGGWDNLRGTWQDHHWNLSDHFRQLFTAGFTVTDVAEIPDAQGLSQWLILEAEKPL